MHTLTEVFMFRLPHTVPATFLLAAAIPVSVLLIALCGCGQMASTAPGPATPLALSAPNGVSSIVPGRYIVVYSNGVVPAGAAASATASGAELVQSLSRFGLSVQHTSAPDNASTLALLSAEPNVAYVLHDRYVQGHQISVIGTAPTKPIDPGSADYLYNSPQGWAVLQAGGYGANIPGGPATGPWNTTMGAGVRIAVLDSGVDATHPDIAPNLALNLSEADQTAFPDPCDDGSPQDQQGHGTWVASLATGAAGNGTGGVIGVAPQATLLNIKVLERVPADTTGDNTSQCLAGQTGGFLSWVLQGIDDAIANKADVISLSLGSIIDLNSGDGAGWKASFDSVTHAATAAGVVIVAAVGNDGLNLSGGQYIELPAQARDVLPVVASTNPACAENLAPNAVCVAGPITRPYYSNYGATINAIAAPGGSLPNVSETGVNGFVRGACSSSGCFALGNQAYAQATGTSASAPLVAGAAALLHASHPNWTATQIVAALRSSTTKTATMTEPELNIPAAMSMQ
jgi:lantibiotic leader peptide-processing serine protease